MYIDVLLGSTEYSTSLDMWGVGCIFVEMVTGMPTFPGIRDTYDQLDKIFKFLGTPTEDTWHGVTHLPGYKPYKLGMYANRFNVDLWFYKANRNINNISFVSCTHELIISNILFVGFF